MTGLILKVRLQLGEQSVLRSGIRPVFWSFGCERCERHQQDRCCSPCGSFWVGLPCLSDHAPVVSTVLSTTKLADLQVLGRRYQSQSGGHRLGRQTIARI